MQRYASCSAALLPCRPAASLLAALPPSCRPPSLPPTLSTARPPLCHAATAFFRAAEEDHVEVLRLLMEEKVNMNKTSQGLLPIHAAARRGHIEATQVRGVP